MIYATVSEAIAGALDNIFSLLSSVWTLFSSNPLLAALAVVSVVAIVGGILAYVIGGRRRGKR